MSTRPRRSSNRRKPLRISRLRKNSSGCVLHWIMLRVPYDDLYTALVRAMQSLGLAPMTVPLIAPASSPKRRAMAYIPMG